MRGALNDRRGVGSNLALHCVARFWMETPTHSFRDLVQAALPHAKTYRDIARELGDRASKQAVREWIRGRVGPPTWAIEALSQRAWRILLIAKHVKPGKGLSAGAANLARYHATRNSA